MLGIIIVATVYVCTIAIVDPLLPKFVWTTQDQHKAAAALKLNFKLNAAVGLVKAACMAFGKAATAGPAA